MLGEIIDFIYERKFIIGLILIALFFISIAVYVYFNNIKPGLNKQFVENREFVSEDQDQNREPKVATLYYFYTNWCPYCKKARPVINEFKSKIENKTFNNNRVIVREVDCETDSGTADKFKIEGYPTIKLVTEDGTVYDYDARPNVETLMQFLNEVL
jgi:thiol-disulfide isomerase/thioredoxin